MLRMRGAVGGYVVSVRERNVCDLSLYTHADHLASLARRRYIHTGTPIRAYKVTTFNVRPGHPSFLPLSIYFLIFSPFTFPFLSLALPIFFFSPFLPFLPE